jgi:hypothetical protein
MRAIFDWDDCNDPTDNCVAYRMASDHKIAAAVYFYAPSWSWSGAPPYSVQINLPVSGVETPWYKTKFYTLGEAKSYVDVRFTRAGYETLPSHLKVLL